MKLFEPYTIAGATLKNRLTISPMVTYHSTPQGHATDWHIAHYGRFAIGGAGMVMVEATAVSQEGRITWADMGLYEDSHIVPLARVADLIRAEGSLPAIQIGHAGRKGASRRAWDLGPLTEEDAARGEPPWPLKGPSALPYREGEVLPAEMSQGDIATDVDHWRAAAIRADRAGFGALEIHAAHGYQLHQFLSPISNQRTDRYGGSLENRMRYPLEVVEAVRAVWPAEKPLFIRISSVDGVDGGWSIEDSVVFAREAAARGIDMVDCSSGGIGGAATNSRIPRGPGFQVPFAERIRNEARVPTIAVGLILTPEQAAEVIDHGRADLVAIGREALVNPNWPNAARTKLQPERGYSDWPQEAGWWLDMREKSMRSG